MARKATRKGAPPKQRAAGPAQPSAADLALLATLLEQMEGGPEGSDLDRAQEKAFEAMEARTPRLRVKLAREALEISPLCSDAHLVLAWESAPEEALPLIRQAVDAGRQALGETTFEEDAGDFWGLLETRPFMRALGELARALWEAGQQDEAVGHYNEMLRLNPNDNQGVRYSLATALIEARREGEAEALLKRYRDDSSAWWAWSEALLAFRREGITEGSRKALRRAVAVNRHVPKYLSGAKAMPKRLPDYIGLGDENEAVAYVHDAAKGWAATEGALVWLREALKPEPGQSIGKPAADVRGEAERLDEAVLALLLLGHHGRHRVWKSFDFGVMNRLHEKGLISDPATKAKSVVLTPEGLEAGKASYKKLFGREAFIYPKEP